MSEIETIRYGYWTFFGGEKMRRDSAVLPQNLEQILCEHITGQNEYPGDVISAVCETLAEGRSPKTDAAGIYRHYLEIFLPEAMKKDL